MLVKERDPGGGGALVSVWDKFAVDSPLGEAVQSELVSEGRDLGAWELRHIPRRLWMIAEAEESYFGLE
jgi:hypothetical protein